MSWKSKADLTNVFLRLLFFFSMNSENNNTMCCVCQWSSCNPHPMELTSRRLAAGAVLLVGLLAATVTSAPVPEDLLQAYTLSQALSPRQISTVLRLLHFIEADVDVNNADIRDDTLGTRKQEFTSRRYSVHLEMSKMAERFLPNRLASRRLHCACALNLSYSACAFDDIENNSRQPLLWVRAD